MTEWRSKVRTAASWTACVVDDETTLFLFAFLSSLTIFSVLYSSRVFFMIIYLSYLCGMRFLLPFFFTPSFAVAERPHSTEPTVTDSSGLRRACSLSDLNRPNVARRILPAPPTNGNCFLNI